MYNSNNKHQENSQLTNHQSPITTQDIAIRVDNLSKIYRLYNSPKDRLKETLHPRRKKYHRDFYALKDLSFEVKKGEILGIIGANGSGKSTLLKILTGVLTPNGGNFQVNGKVSALLELGTGFNPELTGIENVYFNGTLLGFSKEEMDAKLDDILSFADIGEFVKQPVKSYSSGMYVRLAFAVAVQVDPDILIVDEALAVGDARFQLKCMNKMSSFKNNGKTILLVTHDIETIKSSCDIALFLDKGKSEYFGDPIEAAIRYFRMLFPAQKGEIDGTVANNYIEEQLNKNDSSYVYKYVPDGTESVAGVGGAVIESINIIGLEDPNLFHCGDEIEVNVSYTWDLAFIQKIIDNETLANNIIVGISLANKKGEYVFGCTTSDTGDIINPNCEKCNVKLKFKMPHIPAGDYFLTFAIALGTQEKHVQLRWYDYMLQFNCIYSKKYIYGYMHLDEYKFEIL